MATDNEMRAAGIHLPGGSDYISEGDDAISANARVLWDRIEAARFDQTAVPLGLSSEFDALPTNIYTWWSGDVAEALGMPFFAQGTMIMSRWGSAGGVALAASRSTSPTLWINSRLSGGWVGWTQIGGTPEPVQQLKAAGPAGLKTAPLALTTGYGGARTSGTGTTSVIQHLPAATTRLQLRMRNWNPRYTNSDRAAVTLTGVRIGRHTSGGNGTNWINLPAGSTEYASHWIDVPAALRGGEIVVQYTWAGSDVTQCLGTAWTNGSTDQRPPLFVWLALEVPSTTPVVAAFGSSTAAGVGAARPLIDSWLAQWARANDAVPAFWAQSGDSAAAWTSSTHRKWELYGDGINAPDAMLYAMGSNDWAGGASLEDLQTRISANVGEIRRRIGGTLYGTTITPRATPPSNDGTRLALNEWMDTSGLFHGVLDFAGAVALPDGTLDPAVDADGVHVTTAGHARLAAAVPASIVAAATPYVVPWRDVTARLDSSRVTGGRVYIRRSEGFVEYSIAGLETNSNGVILPWGDLPLEYRPTSNGAFLVYGENGSTADLTANSGGGMSLTRGYQGVPYWGTGRLTTAQPWPTEHPGVEAGWGEQPDLALSPADAAQMIGRFSDRLAALDYGSGWRNIAGLLAEGWSGPVFIQRSGMKVEVVIAGIQRGAGAGPSAFVLPAGFRRNGPSNGLLRPLLTTATDPPVVDRTLLGLTTFQVLSTNGGGSPLYGSFTFTTSDPIPTTLPGTPA